MTNDGCLIKLPERLSFLKRFFLGKLYPLIPAGLALLGHITGLEFYLNFLNIFIFAFATLTTASVKPFIAIFLTYTYQISLQNTPSFPIHSGYYLEGARPYLIALLFAIGIISYLVSAWYSGVFSPDALRRIPMKAASLTLAAAFLLGGAFSSDYTVNSTLYGAAQILGFFIVFYVFYLAFIREDSEQILDQVVYVSLLVAWILILETAHLYLTSDNLFAQDGSVIKDNVLYGWGIWNNAGQKLTVVIPTLFIGVMRGKRGWLFYFISATLALGAAVLTLSRTALIFATLAYVASVIIAAMKGAHKRLFRIVTAVGVILVIGAALVLHEKIFALLQDYLERGLDDNGRYELWGYGIKSFLEAPFFGKGFFGLHTDTFISIEFIPQMMHNTPIQLLASMGIFGFLAYAWHRFLTVRELFIRPSLEKTMLGISCLTVLLGSLLENFVFYVEPMFYFSVVLALIFRMTKADNQH